MTHDLFKSFAHHFDFQVTEILILDLKEGVFFAKLVCDKNGKSVEIDSRPSDAIAIGLRFGIDIFTTEQILNEAAVVISEEGDEDDMDLLKKTKKTENRRNINPPQSWEIFQLKNSMVYWKKPLKMKITSVPQR